MKRDQSQRQEFLEKLSKYEKAEYEVVYLDECGFSEFMIRTHGYALRGNRCVCPSDSQQQEKNQCHWSFGRQRVDCSSGFSNYNSKRTGQTISEETDTSL